MKCLVVDDDPIARKEVKKCVEKTKGLSLVAECESAQEALEIMKESNIDLILLDIEMPDMTGIDLIKNFKDIPQIILITSNPQYAAESYDYDVTDFVVKPVDYSRFLKAIEKARKVGENISSKPSDEGHIFIKSSTTYIRLSMFDINWVEALGDYVNIYTSEGKRHTVLSTMKAIESKLPDDRFVRIHRSYIVNTHKINEIEDNTVSFENKILPVSRHYKEGLMSKINLL